MIKKFILLLAIASSSFCKEDMNIKTISKTIGHIIGKQLQTTDVDLDIKQILKGIEESKQGKKPPISENECLKQILILQEKQKEKNSLNNLKEAESFLAKNAKNKNIKEVIPNKLQYKLLKNGFGKQISENDSPLVKFKCKTLSGKVYDSSENGEIIHLQDLISGLKRSLIGMKEGEKREIFIHPELGYGKDSFDFPNQLIIFEIEVIKHNEKEKFNNEIAHNATSIQ